MVLRRAMAAIVCGWTVLVPVLYAQAQQSPTRPGQRGPSLRGNGDRLSGTSGVNRQTSRGRTGVGAGGVPVEVVSGGAASATSRVTTPGEAFEPVLLRHPKYGPIPKADETARMTLTGPMSANEFLDALSMATGWNIAASPAVREVTLEFWTKDVSPRQAIAILEFNDVYYKYDVEANFLFVMTRDEYLEKQYGELVEESFVVLHAPIQNVETVLASLLSAQGRLIVDPATSKIVAYDTEDNLKYMRKAVAGMDVPQQTEAFRLEHVDANALSPSIEALLTEAGQVSIDARSNTLVVRDREEQLIRIAEVIATLDRQLETRSWTLDFADPQTIAENIAVLVPEAMGSIVVNEAIHQVTVTATPYRLNDIDQRIQVWDTKRRQVQIEAYLATAGRNTLRNLGINWAYASTLNGDPVSVAVGTLLGSGSGEAPAAPGTTLNFESSKLRAVIDTLSTSSDSTILAHPRITVQDGEEAVFENTTRVPFASSTTTFGNISNNVNSNTTISFIDVGTILRVVPRITSEGSILLAIDAEDSTFVPVEIFSNGERNTLPQKTQNRAQTVVRVQTEETIILGGLRTSNFADTVNRVPILGDLPIIGRVFRTTGKDHQDRELLIFLTPTLLDDTTMPEVVKLAEMEDALAGTIRSDSKTTFGRIASKLDKGESEFTVSVGQSGALWVEGDPIDLGGLRKLLDELDAPSSKTVVIREHPRAPKSVATEVTELALERGIRVEFDTRRFPFVPRVPPGDMPTSAQRTKYLPD